MKSLFTKRSLVRIASGLVLVIGISALVQLVTPSQVSAQQSITGINAELSSLRSRINRLEGEVSRLSQSTRSNFSRPNNSQPNPTNRSGNPPIVDGKAIGPSDPFYERLATLLIELKEDVRNLDGRLAAVEQRVSEN